jgi:uncharacterized repeat protein (TIGR02543 family)
VPTKAGFTFAGWYSNTALTTPWVFTSGTVTAATTLYAKWVDMVVTYTVTYYANGGSGTAPEDAALYLLNDSATVISNTFTHATLIFQSWNTQSDGLGTIYSPGQSVPISGDITLYAMWTVEHGDTPGTATSITYPSSTVGNIEIANDLDYFAVTVPGAGLLHMDSIGGLYDMTVTLYDMDGTTQLDYDDDDGGGNGMFLLEYSLTQAGTFFIMVRGYSATTGEYNLNVTFIPY